MTTKCTPVASRPFAVGDFAAGLTDTFTGIFASAFDVVVEWQRRANERNDMRHLSDRMLDDMGITRADANIEANKPFWIR